MGQCPGQQALHISVINSDETRPNSENSYPAMDGVGLQSASPNPPHAWRIVGWMCTCCDSNSKCEAGMKTLKTLP
jgi:hypothetical protein